MIRLSLKGGRRRCKTLVECSPCPQWNFDKDELNKLRKGAKVVFIPYICSEPKGLEKLKKYRKVGVLACGAGAQIVAKIVKNTIPLLNTSYISTKNLNALCKGCEDCNINEFGGVCIQRCPKALKNGPCGGAEDGKCELGGSCCWIEIFMKMGKREFLKIRG